MDVSKFNLFGVLFNFKDKKARDDHAALAETVGTHGEDIQGLQAPTFSEPAANANVREAVAKVKSGATLGTLFTNVKAALNGLITLGEMRNYLVNNGTVTETGKYFLDAAYGKTLLDQITALNSNLSQDGTMAHYNTSQLAMDEIYSWIMNSKNTTMNSKMVHCNYAYDTISGELNSGSFLLIGFRNGSYAHITAHSYWKDRAISIGTIEDGAWASRFL